MNHLVVGVYNQSTASFIGQYSLMEKKVQRYGAEAVARPMLLDMPLFPAKPPDSVELFCLTLFMPARTVEKHVKTELKKNSKAIRGPVSDSLPAEEQAQAGAASPFRAGCSVFFARGGFKAAPFFCFPAAVMARSLAACLESGRRRKLRSIPII